MKDKTKIIDFDIIKVLEIEEQEEDSSVNFYSPFCLAFETDKKEQVSLYLDYDRLIDLCLKLKPYLEEYKSREQAEEEFIKEVKE